jgi:protoheme IX farnesyltransferase
VTAAVGLALWQLTKPRIVGLVLVTVAAAFVLASPGPVSGVLLAHTLLGTALVAAGTNALNQVAEADVDARMDRTRNRPLPSGRLARGPATGFAWALGLGGVGYLALAVNREAALLAALTLASYVFLYTPLKKRTPLATLVGAVPGALPVLGGWAAARGGLEHGAWILFGILFLWQLPHFLALAWLYRDEYAAAGLRMLSVSDPQGRITFRQAGLASLGLLAASLMPSVAGLAGVAYFWGAMALSTALAGLAGAAAVAPSAARARRLFRGSVVYLPALLLLMLLDKAP